MLQVIRVSALRFAACLCVIAALSMILALSGCAGPPKEHHVIFQYSSMNALLEGVYDSDVTLGELTVHGDFGIGTFDGLDGEMIALDGVFYQIWADGKAYRATDLMKTPFAVVTFFRGVNALYPNASLDVHGLTKYLDEMIPTQNIFYALRVDGSFQRVKTRSVRKQQKPYPRLVDALKNQPEFELRNVRGTLVGFRCPAYADGINVPGYHFHFITEDRKAGGHVLELQTDTVTARMEGVHEFHMVLPHNKSFYHSDLTKGKKAELEKVEKGREPAAR
ncbi:MAG: acetolactate decarboxylase [Deltaproteobacteria bacterium]|nr:acetolactate decarboxylase [Deltaproteobacteria bacterium]